ncbi:hypothetical protein BSLA_02f2872 [Burkholderia stabilis]|nr:hypothetical protein BSLA_02f2872 [Burkholderia stabilis]
MSGAAACVPGRQDRGALPRSVLLQSRIERAGSRVVSQRNESFVLCRAMPCYAVLCRAMPCYACYACYAVRCARHR